MKYHNVYMYDKINNNLIHCMQVVADEVIVNIGNERDSILKLSVADLEEELTANNLVIGEPDTMRLLYGKPETNSR